MTKPPIPALRIALVASTVCLGFGCNDSRPLGAETESSATMASDEGSGDASGPGPSSSASDSNTQSTGSTTSTATSATTADTETGPGSDGSTASTLGSDSDTATTNGDGDGEEDCVFVTAEDWMVDGNVSQGTVVPGVGADLSDRLAIEFYGSAPAVGTVQLDEGDNANYATCTECVRVFEDMEGSGGIARQYFQQSGSLEIYETEGDGAFRGQLDFVWLVEVTVDGSFNSTPVPGGACIIIESLEVDTIGL